MRSQRGVVNRWLSWQLSQCQRPDAHLSLAEKDNIQLFSANSNNEVTLSPRRLWNRLQKYSNPNVLFDRKAPKASKQGWSSPNVKRKRIWMTPISNQTFLSEKYSWKIVDCVVHYFVFTIFTCIISVSISCTNTFHIASHILPRSLYHTIMIVWNYSGTGRVFMYSQKNRVSPNRLLSSQYQDHRAIFSGDECAWKMYLAQLTSNYFMHM